MLKRLIHAWMMHASEPAMHTCVLASLLRRNRMDKIRKNIARAKHMIPMTTPAILPPDQ